MTIQDSINRTVNLVAVSITGLSAFAFAPEMLLEADVPDKADDLLLFLLGCCSIAWYLWGRNRYARSVVPVMLVALALIIKIGAIFAEIDNAESVGDDFGALILFVLALGLVSWLYYSARTMLAAATAE